MKIEPKCVTLDGGRLYQISGLPWEASTTTGMCTRKEGLRRTYAYEASWQDTEQGLVWKARVWHGGELKGVIGSSISTGLLTSEEAVNLAVRTYVADVRGMQE